MSKNLLLTAASTVAAAAVLSACGSSVTVNPTATGAGTTTTTSQAPTETTTSDTPSETTTSEMPSETTTSETSSEAPTSTSTAAPSPSTSVDAIHKAAFLKVVKQRFPTITDEAALADGQWVCGEMGQDKNILTVIGDLKDKHPDWSTTNAGYFLGVSIGALCPQYTSKVTAGA
ncbi:uncharacterized protein DUF732 [Branchiibius hedensis]|uniref:DUF732 domain-containing protein n=1 Tax=Branchiibius hedensis TaxID=672460 RepID=A0A2Y8ZNT2_9MICO|nr:DUF732 domain-containing protein [Branchiibius hedensis]PWJ25207.1 uncharacterized protein DUF732 [Branchiibius hedensis]SSA34021.1 Protein of unknown function [Branchiibius hedensis]